MLRYLLPFLLLPALLLAQDTTALLLGNPADSLLLDSANYVLLRKATYQVVYSRSRNSPLFSAWHLAASDLGTVDRSIVPFAPETDLPAGWTQYHDHDYAGSGYDRGHLLSSASRTATPEANLSTFSMGNIVPQAPQFNRQTWEKLEVYERSLAASGLDCYVVAGVADSLTVLPHAPITVPAYMWKVIVAVSAGTVVDSCATVIAAWFPNSDSVIAHDWTYYRVSVADIEARTGLTFFGNLPGDVRAVLRGKGD